MSLSSLQIRFYALFSTGVSFQSLKRLEFLACNEDTRYIEKQTTKSPKPYKISFKVEVIFCVANLLIRYTAWKQSQSKLDKSPETLIDIGENVLSTSFFPGSIALVVFVCDRISRIGNRKSVYWKIHLIHLKVRIDTNQQLHWTDQTQCLNYWRTLGFFFQPLKVDKTIFCDSVKKKYMQRDNWLL